MSCPLSYGLSCGLGLCLCPVPVLWPVQWPVPWTLGPCPMAHATLAMTHHLYAMGRCPFPGFVHHAAHHDLTLHCRVGDYMAMGMGMGMATGHGPLVDSWAGHGHGHWHGHGHGHGHLGMRHATGILREAHSQGAGPFSARAWAQLLRPRPSWPGPLSRQSGEPNGLGPMGLGMSYGFAPTPRPFTDPGQVTGSPTVFFLVWPRPA